MHFFPTANAAPLVSAVGKVSPQVPPSDSIALILDPDRLDNPLSPWTSEFDSRFYPPDSNEATAAPIPEQPGCIPGSAPYLRPPLTQNERLRLSMLWYYTKDLDKEPQFLAGLKEKALFARDATGWELAIVGLLDLNVFIRMATAGMELAVLPRGESPCSHTVLQPSGSVFQLPDMRADWRFRESPYAAKGGLAAYAGVPLRMQHESGECVGIGSLCVASATTQEPLSSQQQQTLARLADWAVADMVLCARTRRQRERRRMTELIETIQDDSEVEQFQESILRMMRTIYPDGCISLEPIRTGWGDASGLDTVPFTELKDGMWEDDLYIDDFIQNSNHKEPPNDRVVRLLSAPCELELGSSLLVVATKNFRQIFDDVDVWFVQNCASMLSQRWQRHLLTESLRAKEKFLRGVSHQLRTPIHGILGAAELLAEDLKSLHSASESILGSKLTGSAQLGKSATYLDTISTAGRELMTTVNSMITLSRWGEIAVASRQYAMYTIQDIETALLRGITEVCPRDALDNVPMFFHYDFPDDFESLRTDLGLLRDSVVPLILNAIQNTEDGVVTITLSLDPESETLVIDIEDTGCGIHPNDQARILKLYEKVGEHTIGAGLGLTLAARFATLLQGSVDLVSSEVSVGTHFRGTFGNITTTKSPGPCDMISSKLKCMPAEFQYWPHDSGNKHLSRSLTTSLTRSGLSAVENSERNLIITDYVDDHDVRRAYLSTLPPTRVAICLVPSSARIEQADLGSNILFVPGPFSRLSIESVLLEADALFATLQASTADASRLQAPSNPACSHVHHVSSDSLPSTSSSEPGQGSISDEEQSSTDGSFIHAVEDLKLADEQVPQLDVTSSLTRQISGTSYIRSCAKPRTLIVDDNIVNLRIMQMYCKKRGLPYHSATDGQQAVDIFSHQKALAATGVADAAIELILLDLQMPVCDGITATEQIRDLEQKAGCRDNEGRLNQPVVLFIVTGQDSQSDREAASAAGADDYFVKPVGIKVLDVGLKRYFPAFVGS